MKVDKINIHNITYDFIRTFATRTSVKITKFRDNIKSWDNFNNLFPQMKKQFSFSSLLKIEDWGIEEIEDLYFKRTREQESSSIQQNIVIINK